MLLLLLFFFNDTATTEIYTLSLHDALPISKGIKWEDIENRLETVSPELRTSVGYFPIFETASALCVSQFLKSGSSYEPIWEIESVKERLWEESKSSSPRVRLAIDRQGQIYAFKPMENI